jgi:phosphoribosylanthranilate isomerase
VVWIKICGFCDTESAVLAAELGADAVGLNFVPRSRRYVSADAAKRIIEPLRGRVELVGVVESMSLEVAEALRADLRLDRVQIHGLVDEQSRELPSWAYGVVGIASASDAARLMDFPGDPLLVDALVGGVTGGTGRPFDWSIVIEAAQRRRVVVAGGLNASNVAQAISRVRPYGVDVASGVEFADRPGHKDPSLLRQFIENARAAAVAAKNQVKDSVCY